MRACAVLLLVPTLAWAQGSGHPPIELLDAAGAPVLASERPVSTRRSCATCHDVAAIASGYHAQLGYDERRSPAPSQRPWDIGPGPYGRWDPLRPGRLAPAGEPAPDARSAWLSDNAARHVGGGPGEGLLEVDCFLCHTPRPNREARIARVRAGRFEEAATATLVGTGLVEEAPDGLRWRPVGFREDGRARPELLGLQPPSDAHCSACHGLPAPPGQPVWAALPAAPDAVGDEGFVFSARPVADSAFNLAGKSTLSRPWDVHAARLVGCVDCHAPLNAPGSFAEADATRPGHLAASPRRPSVTEFLRSPSHDFRKGHASQGRVARRLSGSMRDCQGCHAESTHAGWLPYEARHLARLSCQACHVPRALLPSRSLTDWSLPSPDGQPRIEYRGATEPLGDPATLIEGWTPLLLPRSTGPDTTERLQPTNLQAVYYWVASDPPRPVELETLKAALLDQGRWRDEVLAALDRDDDGELSETERWLDSEARVDAVRARLQAAGLEAPRLVGELLAQELHHGVVSGEHAVRDCGDCHAPGGRLGEPWLLAQRAPAGVTPTLAGDATVRLAGELRERAGSLSYHPDATASGLHVMGHTRASWIDTAGLLLLLLTAAGACAHGGLRLASWRRS